MGKYLRQHGLAWHFAVKVQVLSHETGAKPMKTPLPRPAPAPDAQDATRDLRARGPNRARRSRDTEASDWSHPDLARLHRTPSSDAHTPWSLELRAGTQLHHVLHIRH